jgi:hypothetical protein
LAFLLTLWCLGIHGYHPYGEDGGVYLAGIKWLLNPQLYPRWTGFVTAHLHLTLFPALVAGTVRLTHCPLMPTVFLFYCGSIFATIVAGWQLAARCFPNERERNGSALLLAAWLSMPIAGTSLMLADPYLTARSFSTPLGLFALVRMLDFVRTKGSDAGGAWRPLSACAAAVALSTAMHPLMALYTAFCLLLMFLLSLRPDRRTIMTGGLLGAIVAVAALVYHVAPASAPSYILVAHTRTYWFIGEWRWFEWCGLLAPVAIATGGYLCTRNNPSPFSLLALTIALAGSTSVVIASLFAHPYSRTMLIASGQPLRQFHLVYILMILGLGASFERYIVRRRKWPWIATMIVSGALMFFVQAETYPHSAHVELTDEHPTNGWQQAFLWVRYNVPVDAPVAIDSHYTTDEQEDTQYFQAIAERSSVPDYSKDGGVASISPSLVQEWIHAQSIGAGLDRLTDAEREARVRPEAIQWVVLPASSLTSFSCPYANAVAKVCRID